MVICGQEFEFSLMNANDLDRFEDANERMQRRSAEESEQFRRGGVRLGDHARAQARIAMDCIDEILGAGASARLGLDENNMAPIYDVIEELGNAFAAEKQRYAASAAQLARTGHLRHGLGVAQRLAHIRLAAGDDLAAQLLDNGIHFPILSRS